MLRRVILAATMALAVTPALAQISGATGTPLGTISIPRDAQGKITSKALTDTINRLSAEIDTKIDAAALEAALPPVAKSGDAADLPVTREGWLNAPSVTDAIAATARLERYKASVETDWCAAFQRALNDNVGGDIIMPPEVINIPATCSVAWTANTTMRGESASETCEAGTRIRISAPQIGDVLPEATFAIEGVSTRGGGMQTACIGQEQNATLPGWQPTIYPPLFRIWNTYGGVNLTGLYLSPVYHFVDALNAGRLNVEARGQVLHRGITADMQLDSDHYKLHLFPAWSGYPSVLEATRAQAEGLTLARVDTPSIDYFGIHMRAGLHISDSASGTTTKLSGKLRGDATTYPLLIDATGVNGATGAEVSLDYLLGQGEISPQGTGATDPAARAIYIPGTNARVRIAGLQAERYASHAVEVTGANSRVEIGATQVRWGNQASATTKLVSVTGAGSSVVLSQPPQIDDSNGAGIGDASVGVQSKGGDTTVPIIPTGTGGVSRTIQQHLRDMVTVTQYGADPNGVADSTTAFANAAAASSWVHVPCGVYKLNWVLTANNFKLSTASACVYFKPASAGDIITVRGANFTTIDGGTFVANGFASGDGLVIDGGSGNIHLANVRGVGIPGAAVNCKGTVSQPQSGNRITGHSYFLNGNVGVRWAYCHDAQITGAQIGGNSGDGLVIINSGASRFADNFIWENQRAINVSTSNHSWFVNNRLTQSQFEGALVAGGDHQMWIGNQFYENSRASAGGTSDAKFTGVSNIIFSSNDFFDWTGVAHTSYGLSIDATSSGITHTGNRYSAYNTLGRVNILAGNVLSANNSPTATPGVNWQPTASIPVATPTAGVGGSNIDTIYLGQFSTASEQSSPVPAAGLIGCFALLPSATPAVGETWTYTLRKNGADTAIVATQTNGMWAARVCAPASAVAVAATDNVAIKVMTNGATNLGGVAYRGSITIHQ